MGWPLWLPQALNQALCCQCTCVSYVQAEHWARFISNLHLRTSVWYSSNWNRVDCSTEHCARLCTESHPACNVSNFLSHFTTKPLIAFNCWADFRLHRHFSWTSATVKDVLITILTPTRLLLSCKSNSGDHPTLPCVDLFTINTVFYFHFLRAWKKTEGGDWKIKIDILQIWDWVPVIQLIDQL